MATEDQDPPPDKFLVDALPTIEREKERLRELGKMQFYYYRQSLRHAGPVEDKPLRFDETTLPSPLGIVDPFTSPTPSDLCKKETEIRVRKPYWVGLAYFDGTSTKACPTFPTWLPRQRATALWWLALVSHFHRRKEFFEDPELAEFSVLEQAWADLERACSFACSEQLREQAHLADEATTYMKEVARRMFEMKVEDPYESFANLWGLIAKAFLGGRLTERALAASNKKLTIRGHRQSEGGGPEAGHRGYRRIIEESHDDFIEKHGAPSENIWSLYDFMKEENLLREVRTKYLIGEDEKGQETIRHAVGEVICARKSERTNTYRGYKKLIDTSLSRYWKECGQIPDDPSILIEFMKRNGLLKDPPPLIVVGKEKIKHDTFERALRESVSEKNPPAEN